jgi:dolichyl-diphosphooligosaccharide--protein glycosyltransferase
MVIGVVGLFVTGKTQWSGRSMTLLDPTYAKKYIPIIASVSEHQATTWSSFFFDLHFLLLFTPVGLYYCYKRPTESKLFAAIYVVLAVYFASVMVRLLLVLAPAVSIMGGIGLSYTIKLFTKPIREFLLADDEEGEVSTTKKKTPPRVPVLAALIGLLLLGSVASTYVLHANMAGAEAYASPSIILSSKDNQGNR